METIFDFKITDEELRDLFSYDKETRMLAGGFSIVGQTKEDYLRTITKDEAILDIAQLLEYRGKDKEARFMWDKIPDIEREYRGGFDNQLSAI